MKSPECSPKLLSPAQVPHPPSPSSPVHSCPRLLPPQTLSAHKQHLQLEAPVSPLGDPRPLRPNFPSICTARGSSEAHPPPSPPCFTPRQLPFLSRLLHGCLPALWGGCAWKSPAVGRAGVLPSPQLIPPQGPKPSS